MGRELRRKEQKNTKNKYKEKNEDLLDTSIKGLTILKVTSSIILILLVVYYIVAVFITKEIDISEKNNESNTTDTSKSSEKVTNSILAANIFKEKEENYYVYCYDFSDEDEGVANVINSKNDIKIYRLDTSSGLNSKYVTDTTGNKNATGLDNLKLKNPTLLVIAADSIVGYYEGRNEIINFLSE